MDVAIISNNSLLIRRLRTAIKTIHTEMMIFIITVRYITDAYSRLPSDSEGRHCKYRLNLFQASDEILYHKGKSQSIDLIYRRKSKLRAFLMQCCRINPTCRAYSVCYRRYTNLEQFWCCVIAWRQPAEHTMLITDSRLKGRADYLLKALTDSTRRLAERTTCLMQRLKWLHLEWSPRP